MLEEHPTRRPRLRLVRKLAIAATSFTITFVLAEIVARVARPGSHDPHAARERLQGLVARMTESYGPRDTATQQANDDVAVFIPHPLQGFDFTQVDLVYDTELERHRATADDSIDVFIYGGSVSAQVGNLAPQVIVDALSVDPRSEGREVVIHSHGRGGYKQPQTLNALQNDLLYGFRPDVVVLIDGFNEVAVANQNTEYGLHPVLPGGFFWLHFASDLDVTRPMIDALLAGRRERRFATALLAVGDALAIEHSQLASDAWTRLLEGSYRRFVHAQGTYQQRASDSDAAEVVHGPTYDDEQPAAVGLCARIWYECSRSMDALCELHSIRYVHVLQPTLHDAGSKRVTEEETRVGGAIATWVQGARDGYPMLRQLGKRLAQSGEEFFDASKLFERIEGNIYTDSCHYNSRGVKLLARFVADAILSAEKPYTRPRRGREQ